MIFHLFIEVTIACTFFIQTSPQSSKEQNSPESVWPPTKCTPLCFKSSGASGCSHAGKHHELILTLAKCSNGSEIRKTDFGKSLEKFIETKWLRTECVPEKNENTRFPLVHWACILGKYKPLEYLVSEKGFELTVKVGKNKQGPLHSMVQHLSSGLNPKSSKQYTGNMFGNLVDIFLKYVPEVLCEKDASLGDTILHFLARRCSSDPYSRMYLNILLAKIKESDKVTLEKVEEILSAVNKRGDTFLHLIVSDEESVDSLAYFIKHFSTVSEKISKAKNNFGKTPRQLAVEKKSFEMLRALGAPDVVINSLKKAVTGGKPPTPKRVRFADDKGLGGQKNSSNEELSAKTRNTEKAQKASTAKSMHPGDQQEPFPQQDPERDEDKTEEASEDNVNKEETGSRKRPAPRTLWSTRPSKKRGRGAAEWSDSESEVEDDEDLALDDDSDDDLESEEEDEEEEEEVEKEEEEDKGKNDDVVNISNEGKDTKSAEEDDKDLETGMSDIFKGGANNYLRGCCINSCLWCT